MPLPIVSKTLRKIAALFAALLLALPPFGSLSGQSEGGYKFERLDTKDGLTQNTISAILQDKAGYMWIGTQDGLNRYDGMSFLTFRGTDSDTAGLQGSWITSLFEDVDFNIWVGTRYNGVSMLHKPTGLFVRLPGLERHGDVSAMVADGSGQIWLGGEAGLSSITKKNGKFGDVTDFNDGEIGRKIAAGGGVFSLAFAGQALWVGTNKAGLVKIPFIKGKPDFKKMFFWDKQESGDPRSIRGLNIRCIVSDKKEGLWIGTEQGISHLDIHTGQCIPFQAKGISDNSPPQGAIETVLVATDGKVWIGTREKGISLYDPKTKKFNTIRHDQTDPRSLANDDVIKAIYEDADAAIWVGSLMGGISKYDKTKFQFGLFANTGAKQILPSNFIRSLMKDSKGLLWSGTQNAGIGVYDRQTGKSYSFSYKEGQNGFPPSNYVRALAEAGPGKYVFSTLAGGITYMEWSPGASPDYRQTGIAPADSLSPDSKLITALLPGKNGVLWVCNAEGRLASILPGTNTITFHTKPLFFNVSDKMDLHETADGLIWAGGGRCLFSYSPEREKQTIYGNYATDPLLKAVLPQNTVIKSVSGDLPGKLWLSTSTGLLRYDYISGKQKNYTIADGLPNNTVYAALPDKDGHLWISSNKGLARLDIAQGRFASFDINDGLQDMEFNTGAYFNSPDGEMLFGGVNGFNAFYPKKIIQEISLPRVVITDFKILNKTSSFGTPPETLPGAGFYQPDADGNLFVELDYGQKEIAFEFAALHYANPSKNKYAYKLEGFEQEWIYTDASRRYVSYTNLSPGDYVFRVKASHGNGIWIEDGVSVYINISEPFWMKWWFIAVCGIFMFGGANYFIRYRVNILNEKNNVLEVKILGRTEQLREEKERVEEASKDALKSKKETEKQRDEVKKALIQIEMQKNEILKQKTELEKGGLKIQIATGIIEEQNEKLKSANLQLEEKVERRTRQLQSSYDELLYLHKELDTFVYKAAHDLKGPLMRVLGLCQIASHDTDKKTTLAYLGLIEGVIKKMDEGLHKLLVTNDIKQAEIKIEEINLLQLAKEAIDESFSPNEMESARITVEAPTLKTLKSDRALLKIILIHLLNNCIRFKDPNPDKKDFDVKVRFEEMSKKVGGLKIIVQDNGIGVPEGVENMLFDMFFKGHQDVSGSGLGLYMAKIATRKLKGTIFFNHENKELTEFVCQLPPLDQQSDDKSFV